MPRSTTVRLFAWCPAWRASRGAVARRAADVNAIAPLPCCCPAPCGSWRCKRLAFEQCARRRPLLQPSSIAFHIRARDQFDPLRGIRSDETTELLGRVAARGLVARRRELLAQLRVVEPGL